MESNPKTAEEILAEYPHKEFLHGEIMYAKSYALETAKRLASQREAEIVKILEGMKLEKVEGTFRLKYNQSTLTEAIDKINNTKHKSDGK